MILVTDREFLKLSYNVVGGATVDVPVRIYSISGSSRTRGLGDLLSLVGLIIAVPALHDFMIGFAADLAKGLGGAGASLLLLGSSIAATPPIGRATAAAATTTTMTTTATGTPTTA